MITDRACPVSQREWIPVANSRLILEQSANATVAHNLCKIMDACRSQNKSSENVLGMWFNKKGDGNSGYITRNNRLIPVGHVGYIGNGGVKASTEVYSEAFHIACNQAFQDNLILATNGRDIAGISNDWFVDVEKIMREYFKDDVLDHRLAELKLWQQSTNHLFGKFAP